MLLSTIITLAGLRAWHIALHMQAIDASVEHLQVLASTPATETDTLATATALLGRLHHQTLALQHEAAVVLPLAAHAGWLPRYGGDAAAAEPLLEVAVHLTAAGDETATAMQPLLQELDQSTPLSATQYAALPHHLEAARPHLEAARHHLALATAAWEQIDPQRLSPQMRRRVALVEPLLPLLDATTSMLLAADDAAHALVPLLTGRDVAQPLSVALSSNLLAARPQLQHARQHTAHALAAWAALEREKLPRPLQPRAARLEALLLLLRDGIDLALAAPELLGVEGEREYLILAQNPDELRAAGGYISSAGVLRLTAGEVTHLAMRDSTFIDSERLREGPYVPPPAPLQRYMNIQQWAFRDATWSPDFPTSARAARHLYNISQSSTISDVVAFDQRALQLVLQALGPIEVVQDDGSRTTVSAETLTSVMRAQYNRGQAQQLSSDAVVAPILPVLIQRIQAVSSTSELLALARALRQALHERHLFIFLESRGDADGSTDEAMAAAILARRGWDGAVRPGSGDFLMVVESNLGYGKANAAIEQAITYTVDLSQPEAPLAELTLHYTHTARSRSQPPRCLHWEPAARSYEAGIARCYWNYLRVLVASEGVPGNSPLITATTHATPAAWMVSGVADDGAVQSAMGEAGTTALTTFLVVPAGEERRLSLRYRLPASVVQPGQDGQQWRYHLRVQKQAGQRAVPLHMQVRLPAATHSTETSLPPVQHEGQMLTFQTELTRDRELTVTFW